MEVLNIKEVDIMIEHIEISPIIEISIALKDRLY